MKVVSDEKAYLMLILYAFVMIDGDDSGCVRYVVAFLECMCLDLPTHTGLARLCY